MAPTPDGSPNLALFEAWMDTTKWILERTERFPKTRRHTLTLRVETLTLEILEAVHGLLSARLRDDGLRWLCRRVLAHTRLPHLDAE